MLTKRELVRLANEVYSRGGKFHGIDCFEEDGETYLDTVLFEGDESLDEVLEVIETLPGKLFSATHNLMGGEE